MEKEDLFQKIIQTGVEIQNKAVDVLEDLLQKGKIDPEETTKFMDNIHKNIDDYKEKTEKLSGEMFGKMPFVTKKAFEELQEEVKELREQVEAKTKSKAKKTEAAAKK